MREVWQIAAAWRQMWTRPDARGLVAGGALRPAAFSFDIAKAHLLRSGDRAEIGRASCSDRVCQYGSISGVAVSLKKNTLNSPDDRNRKEPLNSIKPNRKSINKNQ